MLKRLFRIGLPAALLVCLGFYWGRQSAVSHTADGKPQPSGESAARSAGGEMQPHRNGQSHGQTQADGLPAIFVGTADEFLIELSLGRGESQYLLYHTVQNCPLDHIISWAKELVSMSPDRDWQRDLFEATSKRWAAADPAAALEWAQSLADLAQRQMATAVILAGIARQDPASALAKVKGMAEGPDRSAALAEIAEEICKTDPLQAIELLKADTSVQAQRVIQVALGNLVRSDPEKALELAANLPQTTTTKIHGIFAPWAMIDPTAALAAAKTLRNSDDRERAISLAFRALLAKDPKAALAQHASLPQDVQLNLNIGAALGKMMTSDRQEALSIYNNLPPTLQKSQLGGIIQSYGQADPEGALSWVMSFPDQGLRARALSTFGSSLWTVTPARRDAIIESIPPGKERNTAIQSFIFSQGDRFPAVAAEMLLKLDPHLQAGAMTASLMEKLIHADLDLAVKVGAQIGASLPKGETSEALERLAVVDFSKAEKYLASLDPSHQLQAMPGIYGSLATKDGPAAMEKVNAIQDADTRHQALQAVLTKWAVQDPDAVLQWSQTAPADTQRKAQSLALATKLEQNAAATLPAVKALLDSDPAQGNSSALNYLAKEAASSMYETDPRASALWVSQLENESHRNEGITTLAELWINDDPVEASVWVRSLPSGTGRDLAAERLARVIQATDPASAFAWASSIESGGRSLALESAFHAWKRQDPAAAAQALQSAPLSDAERASILKR